MELLRFLPNSIIHQYEAVEILGDNSFVFRESEGNSYCLIVPVSDDISAMYRWEDYINSNKEQHLSIVQQLAERTSVLFRENIRLLEDSFPRRCVEEVDLLYQQYKTDMHFDDSKCFEIGTNEFVKLYCDLYNKCWFVKVFNKEYALSNEKAARRIQEIIYYDSRAIIERRWYIETPVYNF